MSESFEIVWAENADVVSVYDSMEEATEALRSFVADFPRCADEIGMVILKDGRGVGRWRSAREVLAR